MSAFPSLSTLPLAFFEDIACCFCESYKDGRDGMLATMGRAMDDGRTELTESNIEEYTSNRAHSICYRYGVDISTDAAMMAMYEAVTSWIMETHYAYGSFKGYTYLT